MNLNLLVTTHVWLGLDVRHEKGLLELTLGFLTVGMYKGWSIDLFPPYDESAELDFQKNLLAGMDLESKSKTLTLPLDENGLLPLPKKSKGKKKKSKRSNKK